MADALGMAVEEFTRRYTRLRQDRRGLSLTEKPDGACIFLGEDGCAVQRVKPQQCRGFPLRWTFEGYEKICAGMRERAGPAAGDTHEHEK
jgi:uncharacterized protein